MSNSDEVDHVKIKMFQQSDIVLQEKSTGDSNEDTSKIDATSNQQIQQSPDEVSVSNTSVKRWVQFEDEDSETSKSNNIPQLENVDLSDQTKSSLTSTTPAAVLTTESVHININNKTVNHPLSQTTLLTTPAVIDIPNTNNSNPGLRTIELSTGRVREGFANGDIIVTLLPVNTRWPWITPAQFRPELVPEELMAQGLTLTVEEYVHALETLVNDFRFTLYNVCYKRVLCVWIFFAFSVLLGLLFSGLKGIALFSLGVGWLFLNAAAIFLCMWVKLRLARGLERCLASVNKQLLRHKIILVLDDRGKISCHKVNLCFMYFDPIQCVNYLNEFIERNEQNGTSIEQGWESRLDVSAADIVIQGNNPTRVSRKQARGQELFLRYLQRWGKEFLRRRLDWIVEESGIHEMPRHLQSSMCHCQFIEEILHNKPKKDSCVCCSKCNDWINRHGERGTLLLLRYTSRWSNEVMRGLADVSIIEPARHCASFICPCQYIERHLSCKPRVEVNIKRKSDGRLHWVLQSN